MVAMVAFRCALLALCLTCGAAHGAATSSAAAIYRHKWDTVADVMGMHGKYKSPDVLPSDEQVAFVAANYRTVTTGSGCAATVNMTLEDGALSVARRIKAANPGVKVGMYMRTDMQLEVATPGCTSISAELIGRSGNDYSLRDDNGTLIKKNRSYLWDYTNAGAAALFAKYLLGVVETGVLDYVYLDGPGWAGAPGIGDARSAEIGAAKLAFFADLQERFGALPGGGRNVILNGVDNVDTAAQFSATGAAGVMFDHWSILQYLNRGAAAGCNDPSNKTATCGSFNATAMGEAFDLARSPALSNLTVQVKGWVGPVIKQQGQYPPSIHTPDTPAEQATVAGERFNSELALFLLVAEDHMFWLYSWFWGFDSWVPDQPDSQTPHGFYPQAKCALGAPAGPPQRIGTTWKFTREFAHASVYVDLSNRTACRVDFHGGSCSASA